MTMIRPILKSVAVFSVILSLLFAVFPAKAAQVQTTGINKYEAAIENFYQKNLFNGTVLISEGDRTIYNGTFGKASIRLDVANKLATKFLVGSNTKCFVATLIWQLVAEGKLSLDGTISQYLPYYTSNVGKIVTIRNLLEMSSGIPDYQTEPGTEKYYLVRLHSWSVEKFVTEFCMPSQLSFEPGTQYQYTDSDYYILGAIIKEITGSFPNTLKEKILIPADLSNSGVYQFYPANPQVGMYQFLPVIPGLADGYVYPTGLMRGYQDTVYGPEIQQAGSVYTSGDMYSNVGDFQKWSQILYTNVLLPEKYRNMMFTPIRLANLVGLKCLYCTPGWNVQYLNPKTYKPSCNCPENPENVPENYILTYFFAGRYPGYISAFMRFPIVPSTGSGIPEMKKVAIIVFSNHDNEYGAMALAIVLRNTMFNVKSPPVNNVDDLLTVIQECN